MSLFPDLRAADESLAPVIARLRQEHEGIAHVLAEVDAALVAMVEDEEHLNDAQSAVEHLSDALLAHLKYEEDQARQVPGACTSRLQGAASESHP
jgi:Hemerythrin HHE cation binding domain